VAAPAPQASPPPAVFPAGTELVTVDVVVVDEKRQPIGGLTRQDFVVREERQPREIVTFEEVRVPEAAAPSPSADARPRASSNTGPAPARTFAIVFDGLHLGPAAAVRARATIASFLREGTRPGDRVMLVPTAAGRPWTATLPEGRADLLALLDTMDGTLPSASGPDHMTDWEAFRIHVQRDERVFSTVLRRFYENGAIPPCVSLPGQGCSETQQTLAGSPIASMKAAQVYDESLARRRATLRVLHAVMESLVPIKGRKSVLLVSQGFILEPSLLEMNGVYDAARRANAAIQFVDVRGLLPMDTTVVDQGRATQATGGRTGRPSNDLGLALDQPRFLSEGADALAAETGGESFKNSNDIGRGFRLAEESTLYYLIGYAPVALQRDGKFRRIEVAVARPKAEVRARRGYVVPRLADLPQRAGAESGAPASSANVATVPLRVAAFPLEETVKGNVRVVIAAEADPSGFGWQPRDDRFEDALDTTLNLLPRSTAEITTDSRLVELSLPAPAREQVERTWLPIVREVELPPGVYQAQLAVRERNTGRAGSVQHTFEVPAAGGFRITAPILTDLMQPAAAAGAPPRLAPLARREFAQGSKLYCHFDVLNATRGTPSGPQVRAGHVLRRADGTVLSRLDPSPVPAAGDGRLSRTLAISLRTATPGPHELVLTVQDEATGRAVETVERFEVTKAEAVADTPPPAVPGMPVPATAFADPRATLERAGRLAGTGGAQSRRWAVAAALMMDVLGRGNDAFARLKGLAKQAPADPDVLLALGALEESRIDTLAAVPTEAPPAGSESLPRFQRKAARDRVLRDIEARYRAVLAARSEDREARLRLGRVLQLRGDRQAVEHLQQVAAGPDGDLKALAFLFLGEWHDTAGQLKEALAAYRQAAAAAPRSQSACVALAQALFRSGDPAGARDTLEKGLAGDPGLDPFLTYERPSLRLGTGLVERLEKEGP
jgi:VWFA-related protein